MENITFPKCFYKPAYNWTLRRFRLPRHYIDLADETLNVNKMQNMNEIQENQVRKRFKETTAKEKEDILSKRKAENTNLSTKLWINALKDYLIEKQYPDLEELTDEQLNNVIGSFYLEARKKKIAEEFDENDQEDVEKKTNYKNSSLRSARAAFTRYFRDTRKLDIRTNELFIESNDIFEGKTKDNKQKGLGKIDNKPPITDEDLQKIADYFRAIMKGPPNATGLLHICVFHIVYYLCRRGRENLRSMKKSTFAIAVDPANKKKFIFQQEDKADKNHSVNDTYIANQGRIYERPGNKNCFKAPISNRYLTSTF